ncbi:MAG: hypothetical protein ACI8RZ_007562 [Myxococcota bacterium]|jgi:hypothetical protein
MTIEPGSLDPWRDVAPHGLTAGFVRSWHPQAGDDLPPPQPHRVFLIALALQPGVLRFGLPPGMVEPAVDDTPRAIGSAKQQGTRWLQRIARLQPGTLSPWQTLPRESAPQSLRAWYGPGGAQATMSMVATPGGVILECRGQAARTRRQTAPLLELVPFASDATARGEAWLEGVHADLMV